MLMPANGSVQALIKSATCLSWRPKELFGGKTVASVGLTLLRALSVWMELERMSLEAFTNLKLLSRVRSSLKEARRELISALVAPGALLNTNTFARGVRSEERRVGKECRSRW